MKCKSWKLWKQITYISRLFDWQQRCSKREDEHPFGVTQEEAGSFTIRENSSQRWNNTRVSVRSFFILSPEGRALGDERTVCFCFVLFHSIFKERLDCCTEHPFFF